MQLGMGTKNGVALMHLPMHRIGDFSPSNLRKYNKKDQRNQTFRNKNAELDVNRAK